ncbi:Hypothetical predicted protein [Octopus vulgaris]|uniref:Uncharacterized protein n=1 Tax=Octopus vulgaris TaxID=6645 RepID=A0AA36FIZ6_OCTVU|nr:Hypothetical predicted protein [Octopus vulgaris]
MLVHTYKHSHTSFVHIHTYTHTELKRCLIFLFSIPLPLHTHTHSHTSLLHTHTYTHAELKRSHFQFAITPSFFIHLSPLPFSFICCDREKHKNFIIVDDNSKAVSWQNR